MDLLWRFLPSLDFSSIEDARWHQFVVRFILGGAVTLCTGLIAQHWGPVVGGLFLSFPAIFPATVTLIERHETEKKSKAGINCRKRGRKAAALDAAGAVLGLLQQDPDVWFRGSTDEVAGIDAAILERLAARKARDFARADAIRAELLAKGIALEDSAKGTTWRRAT